MLPQHGEPDPHPPQKATATGGALASPPAPVLRNASRWSSSAPYLLAGALLAILATSLWLIERTLREEQRRDLAVDAHAAGHAAQMYLEAIEDYLILLGRRIAADDLDEAEFQTMVSRYVADHPGLVNVTWADERFVIRWTAPYEPNQQVLGMPLELPEPKRASREAQAIHLPVYTRPFRIIQGIPSFEVYVPVYRGDEFLGTLGGVYSCQEFLRHAVIAESPQLEARHHISLTADRGSLTTVPVRAERDPHLTMVVALDPPVPGLALHLQTYSVPFWNRGIPYLLLLCAALACGAIWAILAQRREAEARQRAEEQVRLHRAELAHVARVVTLGEMVSGLAHQLNQPLCAIANYAEGCGERLKSRTVDTKQLTGALDEIARLASGAGEMIHHLKAFIRKREAQYTEMDVNKTVRHAIRMAEPEARHRRVTLRADLTKPLPVGWGDAIQIEQAILNLILNGVEAAGEVVGDPREVLVRTGATEKRMIEVAVEDTGAGVTPEAAVSGFDPFFTTKPEGLGMGLAVSRSIIEAHGGWLWLDLHGTQRTTFRLNLPNATTARGKRKEG